MQTRNAIGEATTRPSKKSKSNEDKPKTNEPSLEEMLLPTNENLDDNPTDYSVNFNKLKLLVENCQGSTNISTIIKDYTNDITGLTATLGNLYPLLQGRKIEIRFTKIIKKLKMIFNGNSRLNLSEVTSQDKDIELVTEKDDNFEEN